MSDKHLGRIENSGDSAKLQQYQQPWTPQIMTPKLDLSGAGEQVARQFGHLQIVDGSQTRQLQGSAQVRHEAEGTPYHSDYDKKLHPAQHHDRLHGGANDGVITSNTHPHQDRRPEYLVGQTTIPASKTQDGYRPSENISTSLPAANYHEGERFNQVLNVPHERGKTSYYNGLANAHYEHGHLYGVPVHLVNGQVTSHLDQEIDISLHKKK